MSPSKASAAVPQRQGRQQLKSETLGSSRGLHLSGLKRHRHQRHASRSLEDLLSLDEKEEEKKPKGPVPSGPSELLLSLPDLRANVSPGPAPDHLGPD